MSTSNFVRPLPRVITIANQKGGVGKTTTSVNLSAALGEMGWRCALIDLDPQGNATTGLGISPEKVDKSTYDVLLQDTPLSDVLMDTEYANLKLAPATVDLAGAEVELVPTMSRELRLRDAIKKSIDQFDFVFIDCPPSLGLLTVNGFAAADEILLPIQCEYYALEGVGQLVQTVELVKSHLNPKLEISTVVLTMYDARTKLSSQVSQDVKSYFGDRVCKSLVPRSVRLSEAPSFGQPITIFDPLSRGALAYKELAQEVSGGEA
jgi:chromosome partitioning protein